MTSDDNYREPMMDIYPDYCCLSLVRACESGWFHQYSGGFGMKLLLNEGDCYLATGGPWLNYCPFCGAKLRGDK